MSRLNLAQAYHVLASRFHELPGFQLPTRLTALVFTVVLMLGSLPAQAALGLGSSKPSSFADAVEPLLPSTVNISTSTEIKRQPFSPDSQMPGGQMALEDLFRQFMQGLQQGQPRRSNSLGSGFIIAQEGKKGFIVTCNHVIDGADEIKITLHDGTELDATVVGRDKRTDLALLSVTTDKKLVAAQWGDSKKARVGDWVIAIGNPFGLGSTVTTGIISSKMRDVSARMAHSSGADYVSGYIQTDASINMGNSGGAMFDIDGNVLGVNTAIYSPNGGNIGIGFAIPSALAQKVIDQLKLFGRTRRGWLGVRIQNVTDEIAETLGLESAKGALVGDVAPKGPGADAGLKTQDVILTFNGVVVEESRDLPQIVGESEIDSIVPMEVWRGGKKITLNVKVGEWEKAEQAGLIYDTDEEQQDMPKESQDSLGIVSRALTDGIKERYKLPKDATGVFVTFVSPSSEAFEKFLRPGDVVQQLTSGTMKVSPKTPQEFKSFIEKLKAAGKKKVLVLVNTKGNLRYVALSLEDAKDHSSKDKSDTKTAEPKK